MEEILGWANGFWRISVFFFFKKYIRLFLKGLFGDFFFSKALSKGFVWGNMIYFLYSVFPGIFLKYCWPFLRGFLRE